MGLKRVLTPLAIALVATGCRPPGLTPEHDQDMRQIFAEVRDGRIQDVESALAPRLQNPTTRATFEKLHGLIPPTPPIRIRIVQWNAQQGPAGDHYGAVYQYDYPDRVLVVQTRMASSTQGGDVVETFWIRSLTSAQAAEANRFSLVGKTPLEYTVLVGAIVSPVVILIALIDLIRAKGIKRKWLWALGIVWGVCGVGVNWSNGVFAILFINIILFGAGISKAGYVGAPWIVDASLPLVALLFLFRDRRPVRMRRPTLSLDE